MYSPLFSHVPLFFKPIFQLHSVSLSVLVCLLLLIVVVFYLFVYCLSCLNTEFVKLIFVIIYIFCLISSLAKTSC